VKGDSDVFAFFDQFIEFRSRFISIKNQQFYIIFL
jgi:hypothetical protein